MCILFQLLLPHRLLQSIKYSSLWYTVDPCWLSILRIVVCICQSQPPNSSLPSIFPPCQPYMRVYFLYAMKYHRCYKAGTTTILEVTKNSGSLPLTLLSLAYGFPSFGEKTVSLQNSCCPTDRKKGWTKRQGMHQVIVLLLNYLFHPVACEILVPDQRWYCASAMGAWSHPWTTRKIYSLFNKEWCFWESAFSRLPLISYWPELCQWPSLMAGKAERNRNR